MEREMFSYSWYLDEKQTEMTVIRVYGLDKNNNTICLHIKDFKPWVYVELPSNRDWSEMQRYTIAKHLQSICKDKFGNYCPPYEIDYKVSLEKLYGANPDKIEFTRKKFPLIKLYFNHTNDIQNLSYKLYNPIRVDGINGTIRLKLHENQAGAILKLNSITNVPPSGWLKFKGSRLPTPTTFCKEEYEVSWKNIYSNPENRSVARPLVMAFDLEVNSSIVTTMPDFRREDDKIFQISVCFLRQGQKLETVEKYLLSLGNPEQKIVGEEVKIIAFKSEVNLIKAFVDLVQERQPNIMCGFNIFGFDIPYLMDRCDSRRISELKYMGMTKGRASQERKIKWSSSAYKNQEFRFLDIEGRIFVDILPLARRDYRLSNYTLKNVALEVLKSAVKDPLDHKAIFKCYRIGITDKTERGQQYMGVVGKYCVQDSNLVLHLFEKMTVWIGLCEMSKVTNTSIIDLFTRGQQLKVFSQVYKVCLQHGILVQRDAYAVNETDHYVGATVFPPIPGIYQKVLPFDFTSLYPTTIIAYNICWSTFVEDENVPDEKCHVMEWEDHIGCEHDPKEMRKKELGKIIGSFDMKMKEYRTAREEEAAEVKGVENKKMVKKGWNDKIEEIKEECRPYREERSQLTKSKNKNIICQKRKFRWLKTKEVNGEVLGRGVLPSILSKLLDSRAAAKKEMKAIKKQMEECKDEKEKHELSVYHDVLDQRQNALKVSANSGYGITGVRKGLLPFMPAAMCTTFMGRKAVVKAAEIIQKEYGGVLVYGDTDSNYISFPKLQTARECWDYASSVAKKVSETFPKPMGLAYEEKIYWRFFILTKKRYMSLGCDPDGKVHTKISKKGVLLQRRDNSPYIRQIYEQVVMKTFKIDDYKSQKDQYEDVINTVLTDFNKLCSRGYTYEQFIITKSVGDIGDLVPYLGKDKKEKECFKVGDYKVKLLPDDENKKKYEMERKDCLTEKEYYLRCTPAHVQLAQHMRERGKIVPAGSRLEYVVTTKGGLKAPQYEKIESADYFKAHSRALSIDYLYYLDLLINPLDQVMNVAFKDVTGFVPDFVAKQYKIRLQYKKVVEELERIFRPKIRVV